MKMKKRFLSILLSLVMVLGLLPGMSLTALADGHTHSFTYSAEGDTITATCQNDGCSLTENKVTLRIVPNSVLYYNDGQPKEASLEGLDEFNAATGKNITTDDITYYKGDTNVTAQIKAGSGTSIKGATYTARLDVEGKRATVTFKLTAKPADHVHGFTYTASGNVITATCNQTSTSMAACGLTNKQATLTLNAPEHTTYGDGKAANATFTGEIPGVTNPTINYRRSDTPLSSAPTDAGTYTAWCQLGNVTASVEYTIGKATNNGWTTLPQAINNLVYTGQPQDLITAGVPSAGNALYTVGTDPDNEPDDTAGGRPYTSSVPEMTNAGTYYVWCKIEGGKNYTSINAQKVEVTIARADITPSVSIVGWTYGQTANTPMVGDTDNPGNGEVTYTYKVKDADDSTYKSTIPTAAGNYTVKAVIAETANYNSGVATKDFTISKAALTVTAKDQNVSVGDEVPDLSDPVLDTHYTVAGLVGTDTLTTAPTLAYQKNGNAATPDNTALGTYDIVASGASAGDNYTISYTNGTLTVEKGKAVAATVTANNRTYDGTEKPLVTVDNSTLVGGEMWYALGENATTAPADNLYTTSIPTATNAGTYYVWYKVIGDENHNDTEAAYLTVTILAPISQTVTFKVVNGSWDDGTKADISVTLTGFEGDTLKLAENQIPAVGTKPADTYKAGAWDVVPSTETAITAATTYTYTYAAKDAISQTVTFKVVNGSWDNGNTADITVTLTGLEGDTLKLAENQIPAVGTKPADTFKTGAWDVVPSTETAITAATTYTYTYAAKDAISQTATFKVVNGSWDDGNAADITVTLSGLEGEILKLTADQIPAVGAKPNADFEAGSWDVTPSTETVITEAITYTYTYAAKDYTAAQGVIDAINALPDPTDVTTANKDAIEAARAAYDALPEDQKAKVEADTLKKLADAEAALKAIADAGKLYYTVSGDSQDHVIESGEDATFTVKRSVADENTFSRFTGIQLDGADVDESNYDKSEGNVIIKLKAAYLDTLSVGSHILKVLFTDGSVEIPFTVSEVSVPVIVDPTSFENIAVPSKTFTFKKVWEGGSEKSIDFTLYKLGDTVYHHGFDKKIISKTEWQYNAWFSEAVACYVIEEPVEGYKTRYENVGVYASITDRCCDGGTIVNYRVPKTGDNANLMLWLGCALAGLVLISASVYAGKRKKAHIK